MVTYRNIDIFPEQAVNPNKLRDELTIGVEICTSVAVQNEVLCSMTFAADLSTEQEYIVTEICQAHTPWVIQHIDRLPGNLDSTERDVTEAGMERMSGGMAYPPAVTGVIDYTKLYFAVYGAYKCAWSQDAKPTLQIVEMGSMNGGIDLNLIETTPEFGDTAGAWHSFAIYTDKIMGNQGFCEYQVRAAKGNAVSFSIKSLTYRLVEAVIQS